MDFLRRQFVDGLKAFVIGLVYATPIIIFILPVTIVSVITENSQGNINLGPLVTIVSLCFTALVFLYAALVLAFCYSPPP